MIHTKRLALTLAISFSLSLLLPSDATAAIAVDGQQVEVIDMHLHAGVWGNQPLSGNSFLVGAIPKPYRLYAPALFNRLLDPYAPHIGMTAQTKWAGVDHAVMYAV